MVGGTVAELLVGGTAAAEDPIEVCVRPPGGVGGTRGMFVGGMVGFDVVLLTGEGAGLVAAPSGDDTTRPGGGG